VFIEVIEGLLADELVTLTQVTVLLVTLVLLRMCLLLGEECLFLKCIACFSNNDLIFIGYVL
jgi:hypothetical protein